MAKPRFRFQTNVLAAGETIHKDMVGEFIYFSSVSGAVQVSLDNESPVTVDAVTTVRLPVEDEFKKISITNNTGATITVKYYVGFGEIRRDSVSISGSIVVAGGTGLNYGTVTVDTSVDLIIAANTSRTAWSICNNGAVTVFIGDDNTVTAANGFPILAGEKFSGSGEHAIYGITGSGSVDVRYVEETE